MKISNVWCILAAAVLSSCSSITEPAAVGAEWARLTPAQAEQRIKESESRFTDIRPGTEKAFIWADPERKERTAISLVYIHGYTATRGEVAPVPDMIAKELKANLFYTRLTAHGRTKEAYKDVRVEDWMLDSLEALEIGKVLGDRVILMGTSTGAALATWLATGPVRDQVAGLIYISPNFGPNDGLAWLLLTPLGAPLAGMTQGEYRTFPTLNDAHRYYWDYWHHSSSLVPMMRLVDFAKNRDFTRLVAPAIVFYNPGDTVVNEAITVEVFGKFASKDKSLILTTTADTNNHLLAGDVFSPGSNAFVADTAVAFFRKIWNLDQSPSPTTP